MPTRNNNELSVFSQDAWVDDYNPTPKKNKKKLSKASIFSIVCLSVTALGLAGGIGYLVWLNISNNKNSINNSSPIVTKDPISKIDPKSKKKLLSSTFSIQLSRASGAVVSTTFGTAWSFHLSNDAWYLLTNYHVVMNYLYESGMDSWNSLIANRGEFNLYRTVSDSSIETSYQPFFTQDEIMNSEISIITDNNIQNVNLFSEATQYNNYSLDMALIKIKNQSLVHKLKGIVNDSFDSYLRAQFELNSSTIFANTIDPNYRTNKKDIIIGGFPVRGRRNNGKYPTEYYMELIKGASEDTSNNLFENSNYWNEYALRPRVYPSLPERIQKEFQSKKTDEEKNLFLMTIDKQWQLKQVGNVPISAYKYIQEPWDDPKIEWTLSGGASGSPVFALPSNSTGDFTNTEPNWAAIGIYWGGLATYSSGQERYIKPGFTMFVSSLEGYRYNIYDNFRILLQNGEI